jgi:hypothetical protein
MMVLESLRVDLKKEGSHVTEAKFQTHCVVCCSISLSLKVDSTAELAGDDGWVAASL